MLLRAGDLDIPTPLENLFGRSAPTALEIGFGNGSFLEGLARRYPDWNVLGAETSRSSVSRALRRLARAQLSNVLLYPGDVRFLVRQVLQAASLECVHVNFPDPWPRRRHREHRLLGQEFLTVLGSRLQLNAEIRLTTDHPEYFEFARAQALATGIFDEEIAEPPEETLVTRYALKWQKDNRSIFHVRLIKRTEGAPHPPTIRTGTMQHALMEGDLDRVAGFEKVHRAFDGADVVLLDMYRSEGGDCLVFTAIVEDQYLRQDVLIEARPHPDGVLVGVGNFGHPLVTPGLRSAIEVATEFLESRGLRLLQAWY
jgi:tRNA (guanine-N7-)-methyltransferase